MTVSELIAKLQELPPDAPIVIADRSDEQILDNIELIPASELGIVYRGRGRGEEDEARFAPDTLVVYV